MANLLLIPLLIFTIPVFLSILAYVIIVTYKIK